MVNLSWAAFKGFVTSRSLSVQWIDADGNYYLTAIDSFFHVNCILHKELNTAEVGDFEANFKASGNKSPVSAPAPFAAKTFGSKKLYKRVHGLAHAAPAGDSEIIFTIPYAWVKITGIEFIGAEVEDTAGLEVWAAGNKLNQFGFAVNLAPGFYAHNSEFDADLYAGMQLKIMLHSKSAKSVGINFILNEVKD